MIYEYPVTQNKDVFEQNLSKISKIAKSDNKSIKTANLEKSALKKLEHLIKAVFRCFFNCLCFIFQKNNKSNFYVAFIINGGIGDTIRQISIISEIVKMFPNIVIDIYTNRQLYFLFKGIKKVRFFFEIDLIVLTKKKYDIIYKLMAVYKTSSIDQEIIFNTKDKAESNKIQSNIRAYKDKYLSPLNNNLHHISISRAASGVDNIEDISLTLNFNPVPLEKFGITKSLKYITFNYGAGGEGCNVDSKCWPRQHWETLLKILQKNLKDVTIVQLGVSTYNFSGANIINTACKTSFNELCTILKNSLLHIDIDGACIHIAKAIGTKAIALFGPTSAKITGYPKNINITSSLCRDCYHIFDHQFWGRCALGYEKSLCMNSISPKFVANKAIEYINGVSKVSFKVS
jgi:ADP-heptose:LPS heptosyltransferase